MSAPRTETERLLHYLKKVTVELGEARARLKRYEQAEPVAIVGIACRFPGGVRSAEGLWELVGSGRDAISAFPTDRGWDLERLFHPEPGHPGTTYVRQGGFVDEPGGFDAAFFGISPREALAMDPQQRWLLEVTWEALEHAGIDPASLRGGDAGVFVGAGTNEYGGMLAAPELAGHLLTGASGSVISGRVAYTLGLQGPAITVDTACSSSLVAMHLACHSLRQGECSLALAGGVTVLTSPGMFVEMSRQRGLAGDGRCKTFAAAADGTAWSDGAGVLVLERLSDAHRHGRRVWGLVRSIAVNQDGASNGLTAPNGPSQERVISQALASAGLGPGDVDVVEAHGTGTTLGDPIEARALLATYGQQRGDGLPLWLGSIKSNIAHSAAAAGVAGVIKMLMALEHQLLPPTLHVDAPTPHVDWDAGAVRLLTEAVPWPAGGRPRRAGVSSFGMSGTNAHMIVEEAPPRPPEPDGGEAQRGQLVDPAAGPVPWVLSAKTEGALTAGAARLAERVRGDDGLVPADVGRTLATGRARLAQRAVVIGRDRDSLLAGLDSLVAGDLGPGVVRGAGGGGKVAFVFPGQGSQWAGMAVGLASSSGVFADRLADCERALSEWVPWSLDDVLHARAGAPALDRLDVLQPVMLAVMVSLAELWRSCGVAADVVLGHSQGEIAAACVAGALSLRDAARIVTSRSEALNKLVGRGGLISISHAPEWVAALIERSEGELSIAAFNGPAATVVGGDHAALDTLLAGCAAQGVRARRIPAATVASHSERVEPIRDWLLSSLASIEPGPAAVRLCSSVTGGYVEGHRLDAEHWYRGLREPVRFWQASRALVEDGVSLFIEVSAHPLLTVALQDTIDAAGEERSGVAVVGSLRRDDGDLERFMTSLGEAFAAGAAVDWGAVFGTAGRTVQLPGYAFERSRYWLAPGAGGTDPRSLGLSGVDHPLLSAAVSLPGEGWMFSGRLSLETHPWLADHAALDTVLLPGAAFVELALAAGVRAGCGALDELVLEELTLHVPLVLEPEGGVQLRVSVEAPREDGRRVVAVSSRAEGGGDAEAGEVWARHASGVLGICGREPEDARIWAEGSQQWPPAGAEALDVDAVYDALDEAGYGYGPAFRGMQGLWRLGDEVFAEVALSDEASGAFGVHPALLDGALHAIAALGDRGLGDREGVRLPFAWTDVRVHAPGAVALRVRVRSDRAGDSERVQVAALDGSGRAVLSVGGLVSRTVQPGQLAAGGDEGLLCVRWPALSDAGAQPGASAAASSPAILAGAWADAEVALIGDRGTAPGEGAAARYRDLAELCGALDAGTAVPSVVLREVAGHPDAVRDVACEVLALLQTWLADDRFSETRLIVLTRGAVAVNGGELPELAGAGVWGLVRSAQAEHPGRFTLLDAEPGPLSPDAVATALASGESQLAVRAGVLHAPRLVRFDPGDEPIARPLDRAGTVVITGGTGGLGGLVARRLVADHGARHLVLASRNGSRAPGAAQLVGELEALGAEVRVVACDVGDRDALTSLVDGLDRPLTGIVHAAGVLDDGVLEALDRDRVDRVFAPKVDAALWLDELTRGVDLALFAMCSSVTGTLGSAGQASYAAANALLDAIAQRRRASGLAATSIAWGYWPQATGPTAAMTDADLARVRRGGMRALSDEEGLRLFDAARAVDEPVVVAAAWDRPRLRAQARAGELADMFAEVVRVPAGRRGSEGGGALARRLAGVSAEERDRAVLELVRAQAALVLGHDSAAAVDARRTFKDLGFDSLGAVELRNRVARQTGLRLPATLIFDHPTPAAAAAWIGARIAGQARGSAVARRRVAMDEPVAVVGMACRYPGGVSSAQELWELVAAGSHAISAFPTDRGWDLDGLFDADPDRAGKSYVREGGFVDGADRFDAAFFGISPREALAMDPQQRWVLEVGWEALEHAGIDPSLLRGSDGGVFVGAMNSEYGLGNAAEREGFTTAGSGSVISGRAAYVLGLEGPAMTVDTACSSSLVALHLACQSLRHGECSLALAGGVTVLGGPAVFVDFSRQRGLAPDGRCKAFASAADGTAFSEGAGLLVLERLSDARRHGRRIWGLMRGSAVNQDGASNGLTAPNGPSQERVIAQALANAGLAAGDVDVVEAHGTGTRLGDPIEAQALLATYGRRPGESAPLWLGSIKSNIGHSAAAAGVAGVIKMLTAFEHRRLPATLHVDAPTPQVDWDGGQVRLLIDAQPWPDSERPRRAAVSSFGISGTNAHMILEEPPADGPPDATPERSPASGGVVAWPLSAKTEGALARGAARLAERVRGDDALEIEDVGFSLGERTRFERRAVVLGRDREALLGGLDALASGEVRTGVTRGVARDGKIAMVFPGQGSQWAGMAVALAASSRVFADELGACEQALSAFVSWSLDDVLRGKPGAPGLGRVDVVQPALFAVMMSLAALWRSSGVEPDVVMGHSQGEIAAACVAGALSLEDAARVVALRSQALAQLAGMGGMVSLMLAPERVATRLARWDGRVSVAAFNGPSVTVVSGDGPALDELLAACEADGVHARRIAVDYASHSVQVEEIRDRILTALAPIEPRSARIAMLSTLTGERIDGSELDAEYWYRGLREPVLFAPASRALIADGVSVFVEVSAHPVLTIALQDTIDATPGAAVATVGSLRRDDGDIDRFTSALGEAFVAGAPVDWGAAPGNTGRRVPLPAYAFERSRYWLAPSPATGDPRALGLSAAEHPLLGAAVALADEGGWVLSGRVSLGTHPWLADHVAAGRVLLPATAFVEVALAAGVRADCGELDELVLEELTLFAPLVLEQEGAAVLQVRVEAARQDGRHAVVVSSRPERDGAGDASDADWLRHASGVLGSVDADAQGPPAWAGELQAWPPPGAEPLDVDGVYESLEQLGMEYGPAFQGLRAAWRRGAETFAEVALGDGQLADADSFGVHPALFDAALHAGALGEARDDGEARMPFAWTDVRVHAAGATTLRVRVGTNGDGGGADGAGVRLAALDDAGRAVLSVGALVTRPVRDRGLNGARAHGGEGLLAVRWPRVEPVAAPAEENGSRPTTPAGGLSILGTGIDVEGAGRYADLDALDAAIAAGERAPAAVLLAVDRRPDAAPPDAARAAVAAVLDVLQAWLAAERFGDTPLVVATRGAVAVGERDVPDVAGAGVWGLVRSAQAEHPDRFVLLDLDGGPISSEAIVAALESGEPQLAMRDGHVHAPRLTREPPAVEPLARLDGDGVVLVTGATGGLGPVLARHLAVEHGVRHLVLASRGGPDAPGAQALVGELEALGAAVRMVACDVADRAAVAELVRGLKRPLTGVVHVAGVPGDGILEAIDRRELDRVFAPKVDGALWLDELTRDRDLALFVLYSSVAGTRGASGQAGYAAANAALDAVAQRRRAAGLAATSIAWGYWPQTRGMSTTVTRAEHVRWRLGGGRALTDEHGLRLFDAAACAGSAAVVAVAWDHAALRAQARAGSLAPMMSGLVRVRSARRDGRRGGSLERRLAGVATKERERLVLELVRAQAAIVLGHDSPAAVDAERAFKELGFDSLAAVELRNRLARETGLRLPATLVFAHPTPTALAAHISELAGGHARAPTVATRSADVHEPIAVVGMGCRYPGGVSSAEELWDLVASGREAISAFPTDRGWDLSGLSDPDSVESSYVREGGFVEGAAEFDGAFFGYAPRWALAMDPQQRWLLEVAWEALEHAGIDPSSLRGSAAGVFVGATAGEYAQSLGPSFEAGVIGNAMGMASGQVAYALGLEGPAITVDTACSASLVAMHLACQALRQGECSLALAGGVALLGPRTFVELTSLQYLAPDARSRSFAAEGDGAALAEGCGLVVLERLSDAVAMGHHVFGLVRGSAVNQDGASNGIMAPSSRAQERLIAQALASGGLAGADVDVVEGHGTGTHMGDALEAQALLATYGQQRPDGPVWLGSIKSNIGHALAAGGVAGVIKMLMAMRAERLPATLHVDAPVPDVDWTAGDLALLTEPRAWARGSRPRLAGVSAFGMTGTNAHVILEEPPAAQVPKDPASALAPPGDAALPWVLSAKSDAALTEAAARLAGRLRADASIATADVGFTLACRARFDHRAVVAGDDRDGLLAGLEALARGERAAGLSRGVVRRGKVVMVFAGQGTEWPGMAVGLAASSPAFAERLRACERALSGHVSWSLEDVLRGAPGAPGLERVDVVAPASFAVAVSLAELWRRYGVSPDVVVGHADGEIAAACVAGALSLDDGARVAAASGRALAGLADVGTGTSGRSAREQILTSLATIEPRPAGLAMVSSVTGERVDGAELHAQYWYRALSEPPRFAQAIRELAVEGAAVFIEVGAQPPATSALMDGVAATAGDPDGVAVVTSLRREDGDLSCFMSALGEAFVHGATVDWGTVFEGAGRRVQLPTYAFERRRYWPDPPLAAAKR